MFTGLIEEMGQVKKINISSMGMELTIECSKVLEDIYLGASICINGACQTVIKFDNKTITVQAPNETLDVTAYKKLKCSDFVNLERPLTMNKRIDGHIVTGHVDCSAVFIDYKDDGFSKRFFFKVPEEYSKYIIYKGSIAINGVSLTIASVDSCIFSVELIPSTLKQVNLACLKKGDLVNIETDLFAKYTEKILKSDKKNKLDYNFLRENGFV